MGLSAGTAVAVYGLEELPPSEQVENALLLSPSLSADYDLTRALKRVHGRMYVFASSRDAVLRHLVSMVGTADREAAGTESAGLYGFRPPAGASKDTRKQYAKLTHIHWTPELSEKGHRGGHTDVVSAAFVQETIAPLVMTAPTRPMRIATRGMVPNPDYERWEHYAPGSWVQVKGHETLGNQRRPVDIRITLLEKQVDKLVVEWAYDIGADDTEGYPDRSNTFIENAWIQPQENPRTHPRTLFTTLPEKTIRVGAKQFACEGKSYRVKGTFPDWGSNISSTLYTHENVPGSIVRVRMQSSKDGEPFEFAGEVVDFSVAKGSTVPGRRGG
jgi:hypothetical protein